MARITPENARTLALKSAEVRRTKRDMRVNGQNTSESIPRLTDQDADSFTEKRLIRIRKQLKALDDEIEAELDRGNEADGQRINWLVTASERLSNQEFSHANRPKLAPLKVTGRQSRSTFTPSSTPPPASD